MEKIKALKSGKGLLFNETRTILTNAIVVDDAIRFVQSKRNPTTMWYPHLEIIESINEVEQNEAEKGNR